MKYSVKQLRNTIIFAVALAVMWHGKLKRKPQLQENGAKPHPTELRH